MKIRTFLLILALLGVLYAIAFVWNQNQTVLMQRVYLWGDMSVSVALMLAWFFAIGFVVTFLAGFSREFSLLIERSRLRRASRKFEDIEDEYSRGLVAVLEGREDAALAHFRAVLERDSRHFNTLLKVGEVLRNQGKFAEAIEYHRKAHHLKEDNTRPLYALVDDHEAKGDMARARVVLAKIIGINKHSVSAWRKLRSVHVKERNWKPALEAHERVVRLSGPNDPQEASDRCVGLGIRYEIAAAKLQAGKLRESVGLLRKLIKDDASFIPAHVKLGQALAGQGQESDAAQVWFSGFEATGSPIFLSVLEEYYLQREQPLGAIEALKHCIGKVRKDTLPRFYLGKLYFRLEMLDDAMSVLTALKGRASYAPTLHYLLGRIHERRNNHREANSEYRKVIKEMDLVQLEYGCRACGTTTMEWTERCAECREWNTVEVAFREEIPLEELGLAPAPIYTSPS